MKAVRNNVEGAPIEGEFTVEMRRERWLGLLMFFCSSLVQSWVWLPLARFHAFSNKLWGRMDRLRSCGWFFTPWCRFSETTWSEPLAQLSYREVVICFVSNFANEHSNSSNKHAPKAIARTHTHKHTLENHPSIFMFPLRVNKFFFCCSPHEAKREPNEWKGKISSISESFPFGGFFMTTRNTSSTLGSDRSKFVWVGRNNGSLEKLKHDPNQWAKGKLSIKVRLLFWSSTVTTSLGVKLWWLHGFRNNNIIMHSHRRKLFMPLSSQHNASIIILSAKQQTAQTTMKVETEPEMTEISEL